MSFSRIFVIGFPKCGTSSIHFSLEHIGIKSIHWAHNPDSLIGLVGISIQKAKNEGLPLLTYLSEYAAFTQMETCINNDLCYWPQLLDVALLDEQYPGSRFIFNDRNISGWIRSVTNWNLPIGNLRKRLIALDIPGLPSGVGEKDSELEDWYLWHKRNMIDYFKGKDNFILFNIEEDSEQKLGDFLGIKDFNFYHKNASKK